MDISAILAAIIIIAVAVLIVEVSVRVKPWKRPK